MKKIYSSLLLVAVILQTSCIKKKEYLNTDTKSASTVPATALFSYSEKQLSDVLATSNWGIDIFRLIAQQWSETTAYAESDYDLKLRNVPDAFWAVLYRDVLRNLYEANKLVTADATLSIAQKNNQLAQIAILEVYTYTILVNTYGNVPYTQAEDYNNTTPAYDDAATIYASLVTKLDGALTNLNTTATGMGTADIYFNGVDEINAWKKFGNSLKLKIGITLADVSPAEAKTLIEAAAPNVLQSNADNVKLKYLTTTPNTNPVWVDQVQGKMTSYVAAKTLVDLMNGLSDPRLPSYYTTVNGAYIGGNIGTLNTYNQLSTFSSKIAAPDLESLLLDDAEVEFDLAEAVERGYSVGGTAAGHYENAVRASISYWGGSTTDADAYLANPKVAYVTAAGTYKQKIGNQKYIALYNRGYDAWTEVRRLGLVLPLPPNQTSYMNRFTYPITEQNVNGNNYNQASAAIGGDNIATKLFWDKN
jgi:hypothetical protein